MAIDVEEYVDEVSEGSDAVPLKYPPPDFASAESIRTFIADLKRRAEFGTGALARSLEVYMNHTAIAEKYKVKAVASLTRLNGHRTPAQLVGDSKRSVTGAARRFYESCSDKVLDAQMKIADLNPKMYEGRIDKIDALVEWHKNTTGTAE